MILPLTEVSNINIPDTIVFSQSIYLFYAADENVKNTRSLVVHVYSRFRSQNY